MRAWPAVLVLICGWLTMACATAATKEYALAPVPDWVQRIAPAEMAEPPTGQISQGVHHLLIDTQTRVDAHDKVHYRHIAAKALSERGVESVAHVEIRFDPSYQALTLHMIQVRRGARVTSKLANASVKILQREKELEYLIFDGSKTANVFLDDIRVGDVVEYSYSLRGSNPVFGNRQFGRFDLQWSAPVHQSYSRLLWPTERPIEFAARNGAGAAVVSELGAQREYVWQGRDIAARVVESNTPDWFDPYPAVQWSEFKDWQAVARWAVPYYRLPAKLSPALQAEVDRIAKAHASPQERLLATLQFAQREIRYLGVEIGPGSHAPSQPQQVLERRFGDCKDKSLLTMTMLQALGIEARAALVNTSLRRGIRELQPTPFAFNHVLVRASIAGRTYWIDPTRAPQKGDIAHLYQPDYDATLVVDDETTGLVPMANDSSALSTRNIRSVYEAQDGFDKPVRYTVTTIVQGAGAEALRATLSSENREDLQKRYLNFYARYYPKLTMTSPISVQEDENDNRLTMTEHYLIDEFWKRADERKRLEANINVPEVDEYLRGPRDPIRSSPLALNHPVNLTHTTEVRLPEAWDTPAEKTRIEDASFEFERRKSEKDKVLLLVDTFRSRADHVAAADTARYAANLDRARDAVDYALYKRDNAAPKRVLSTMERFNWPIAMVGVLLLAGFGWLAAKLYRYDPPAAPREVFDTQLQGIGGWLLLPAFGLLVAPFRLLMDLSRLLPSYATDSWTQLTTVGGDAYHAMWAPVLLFELANTMGYLVFMSLLLVMFFQKRRVVPLFYPVLLGSNVLIQGIDIALVQSIPSAASAVTGKDWGELLRGALFFAIWASYFRMSQRVKATFVHGRDTPKSTPAITPTPTPETTAT
jgi:transglutaminase-like putative cysteine protease